MQFLCFILMIFNFLVMALCVYGLGALEKQGDEAKGLWFLIFLLGFNIVYMMQSM